MISPAPTKAHRPSRSPAPDAVSPASRHFTRYVRQALAA